MSKEDIELTSAGAFREIQRNLVVLKTQYNEHSKFYFRSTEDILMALKPMLAKYELQLTMSDDIFEIANNAYVRATVMLSDWRGFEVSASSVARDSMSTASNISLAPMATNAASSFARKQALSGLFMIDDSATIVMSKDEQEEADKIAEKAKQEEAERLEFQEEVRLNKITIFMDDAEKNINNTLSLEELQAIYKALYREARKFGQAAADSVEQLYKLKKELVK